MADSASSLSESRQPQAAEDRNRRIRVQVSQLQQRLERFQDALMTAELKYDQLLSANTDQMNSSERKGHLKHIELTEDEIAENQKRIKATQVSIESFPTAGPTTTTTVSSTPSHPITTTTTAAWQPATVRLPSGLPHFKRPTTQEPNAIDDFLLLFVRRLRADDYPVDRYPAALAACCDTAEGDWIAENLSGLAWEDAKERFLRHFVDEDIGHHYEHELVFNHRSQSEDLLAFSDRYISLMKRAGKSPDQTGEYTIQFMSQLS
jgi:hypothetical protein